MYATFLSLFSQVLMCSTKFISNQMRSCEPWKSASDKEFDNAMEGMEKLVMNQLYQYTFTPAVARDINPITGLPRRPISVDDLERDRILSQRVALFGWIEESHLDVPVGEGTAGFLMFAEQGVSCQRMHQVNDSSLQELLKIGHYKAPRDKLICILNCCKVIFGPPPPFLSPLPFTIHTIHLLQLHLTIDIFSDCP